MLGQRRSDSFIHLFWPSTPRKQKIIKNHKKTCILIEKPHIPTQLALCLSFSKINQTTTHPHQPTIMDAILKLAQDSGMSKEQGTTATGGLMSMVKQYLPADQYAKLENQIPGLKGAEEQYGKKAADTTSGGGGGGLMGAAMGAFGGGGGGGSNKDEAPSSTPALLATLTSMGINPSMMSKFLPQISTFLKDKYGVDISQYVAGAGGSSSGGDSGGSNSQVNNLMGQAMGMFGK